LQDVRRADGTRRQDDLARSIGPLYCTAATATREFDTGRALPVKQNAVHLCMGDELQVWPLRGWLQIGACGAGAAPAAARPLAPPDAVLVAGRQVVDVLAVFETDLFAGLEHGGADRRPVGP
jgi:hypothetical protein